ncbi:arsenate reductase [Lampropedia aestuarii]|uniref:arsenate reductase n=1 Tax=Lampropedia aestuarii TaxID=2562762 RepID=UPI0024686A50|nr:arsenate reductase [Lampropedia aestuarii]MDH5857620.1 arsenate reductase [Lampropedia aestuarii]
MTTIHLYGIPNCDTVKKSRLWFADQGEDVQFHDFKKQGLDAATLAQWAEQLGVDALLNRRGTTWRKLSDAEQASASESAGAQALMLAHTSLIKRPVVRIEREGQTAQWTLGYVPDQWQALLGS